MAPFKVSVRKGREWQIRRGHPWLFSGAVSQAPSKAAAGDIVDLVDTDGGFIARGYYNPGCDIAVRVLTRDQSEEIDRTFIDRRVAKALALRADFVDSETTNVYRLINSEGDFLPGLIVDRFDDVLVVQSHTAGADRLLPALTESLVEQLQPRAIIVRNDSRARQREKLPIEPARAAYGDWPAGDLIVRENSLLFKVDLESGQKTGFFADQREKRAAVAQLCRSLARTGARSDLSLANCFSYSAAFTVYAAAANPDLRSVSIDSSAAALELARQNLELNGVLSDRHTLICADAFAFLESQIGSENRFDVLILDPPAFAKSHKDKTNAMKAYTRLNTLGISCVKPGGYLLTCSCSGCIELSDLEEAVNAAAAKCSRKTQIVEVFQHSFDHPIDAAVLESGYLKVLLCRVT